MLAATFTLAFVWIVIGIVIWILRQIPNVPSYGEKIIIGLGLICSIFYILNLIGFVGHDIPVPKIG